MVQKPDLVEVTRTTKSLDTCLVHFPRDTTATGECVVDGGWMPHPQLAQRWQLL